jgi:hypothetical protein
MGLFRFFKKHRELEIGPPALDLQKAQIAISRTVQRLADGGVFH